MNLGVSLSRSVSKYPNAHITTQTAYHCEDWITLKGKNWTRPIGQSARMQLNQRSPSRIT